MKKLASSNKIRRHPACIRDGLTLIELMIAVALTLVIVAAMIRAFTSASDQISEGRAKMDMHNKIRMVTETLRNDLQNATCSPRPRGLSDERSGYFEIVEGAEVDADHAGDANPDLRFLGDHDDVLSLTVRSDDVPFRGRFDGGFVESYLAEVTWWQVHEGADDYDGNFRLYRRVLLIRPDLTTTETNFTTFYDDNDISVRREEGGPGLLMNSLEDLADRRNRFCHNTSTFPHELIPGLLDSRPLTGIYEGEDLMLDKCIGFDIKVFAPNAPVKVSGNYLVETNDPGYAGVTDPAVAYGGYVDLGHGNGTNWFSDSAWDNGYTFSSFPNTYCTWTAMYESDGEDQDSDGLIDEGVDGVDNNNADGIDENAERETQPPYPWPIRSIQVSIRMLESKSNIILQKSIKESFVPN
ncbi:MAG: PilW family protein [Pirellulaceae bacterium]